DSVMDCSKFFLQQTPPNIPGVLQNGNIQNQNRYKVICQTLSDQRTFVTVYDTKNKIPVFSASRYTGSLGKKPKDPRWLIEPQLEDRTDDRNMREADVSQTYNHQAVLIDYKNNQNYDRGHLLPSSYGLTETNKQSTFTLTNVVPQIGSFNKGSWNKVETCIRCVMDKFCYNNNNKREAFVVVGAEPGNNTLLNNKVNIPSKMWTAFCCYSKSQKRWLAGAHWGKNEKETPNTYLQTKTLAELSRDLGKQFDLFPVTQCPLHTTVTELYPQLKRTCKCPSRIPTMSAPPTTPSTTLVPTSTAS
ncbi:endonuclease domain-containing 1 protein-like, partial [Parambassis ranga]|uniref:Endonuclease domain-containing 1 protein-like n=1 Tax=Parambassis ranga TaxID=210632 RepID=A0A6P7I4Q5_9TELE